jgi:iron complex outermembrane receptor protein
MKRMTLCTPDLERWRRLCLYPAIFCSAMLVGSEVLGQDIRSTGRRVDSSSTPEAGVVKLEEVVVTARKREELLRSVPVPVSAVTDKQVREYRLWNNKDLTAIVPNLYAADPGDGRDVISVRGITTTSYDPAVATYIDGVNQFGGDTYIPALFDVERIEVLRGPQGTLYGRNAMGGVINIITKKPSGSSGGFAEISAGSYGQQRYSAGFRVPLVKDKLFLGVAGLYDGRNGYYTNLFTGGSYDKQHSLTGNYYLKYRTGGHWMFDLNVKHRSNRNNGAFPLVFGATAALTTPFVLNQNATTTMVDNTLNASLAASYTGTGFNFTSQTAWQNNYRYYTNPIDGDFSPLDAISIINNYGKNWNNVRAVTQDFHFTSPAASGSRWKWTAGSYLFFQDAPNKQATRYGPDANLLGVGDSLFSTINTTKSHRWGLAFYGQAGYAFTEKLNFGAGIRYDYEHQEESVLGEYQHDPSPDPVVIRPDTSGSVAFHAISPELSLDYHVSGSTMLYARYSRGFRTGGLTQLSSDPSAPPLVGFRPETSSNYEVGVKGSLPGGWLRIDADVFYSRISNVQVPTLVLPDAITITKNAGRLGNRGAEVELSAAPLKGLSVLYNWGYTYSRFDQLELSENGSAVDLSGKHQVFTPDMTSLLAVQYTFPVVPRLGLRAVVRGEWKYIGTTYFDLDNTIRQSSYSLYNVRGGVAAKKWELMFWGRNIGNTRYIAYGYDFGAVHLGDPRTWGASLFVRIPGK